MDILIKSFNRPYYLDRCLKSMELYIDGNYKITVLDDGTPEKYLHKIKIKHPNITILRSPQYAEKVKAIAENLEMGTEINGFKIPISFWKDAVKNSSEYFIITEDDVWLTAKINVNELAATMREKNMALLKLGWINQHKIKSKFKKISSTISIVEPHIFSAPRWFMKNFIFQRKWKVYSLLFKLGIVDNNSMNEYWTMNALLMGMYSKEYWLALWSTLKSNVDEKEQLANAVQFYRQKKHPNLFGKLNFEMMNTTFQSSATNSYHHYGENFDVNAFNFVMNEEWYDKQFDSMENFPADFSETTITKILQETQKRKIQIESWKNWVKKFNEQYGNIIQQID